jgi:hypothetical protein
VRTGFDGRESSTRDRGGNEPDLDGNRSAYRVKPVTKERKRRGSNPHLQNLVGAPFRVPVLYFRSHPVPHSRWLSPRDAFSPQRYRARARKLTPEQESTICALAGTKSLRSLAADFGVSHETIRAVVQQNGAAPG